MNIVMILEIRQQQIWQLIDFQFMNELGKLMLTDFLLIAQMQEL